MNFILSVILVEILCVVGVAADYFLKIAGSGPTFIQIRPFVFGFILQASTAIGWFFVLKYMKFVQVGVFYSVSIVLMLALIGVWRFDEELATREILGICFAVASLLLLAKYS